MAFSLGKSTFVSGGRVIATLFLLSLKTFAQLNG